MCVALSTRFLEVQIKSLLSVFFHFQDKANSNRKVRIIETVEAKPELAVAYLENLFSRTSTREKVLALGEQPLKRLHTVLGNWKVS